jgi:CRP-like cAMP-binding protein
MPVSCRSCPLRKLDCFVPFEDREIEFMNRFKSGELHIEPHTRFLMEGASSPQIFTALRGLGLKYKLLENGRRQVINMIFPGDFLGLQAGILGEMKHTAEAVTSMTLCVFERKDLWEFFKSHPDRAFDITWLAAVEEHFLGSALTSLGQRTARERLAWALARIYLRGEALGMVQDGAMPLPYKQQDLADALGLSLVHTNKTLARLRDRQIANWSGATLTIHDLDALKEIAVIDEEPNQERPLM